MPELPDAENTECDCGLERDGHQEALGATPFPNSLFGSAIDLND
jgi:hypothetical protein